MQGVHHRSPATSCVRTHAGAELPEAPPATACADGGAEDASEDGELEAGAALRRDGARAASARAVRVPLAHLSPSHSRSSRLLARDLGGGGGGGGGCGDSASATVVSARGADASRARGGAGSARLATPAGGGSARRCAFALHRKLLEIELLGRRLGGSDGVGGAREDAEEHGGVLGAVRASIGVGRRIDKSLEAQLEAASARGAKQGDRAEIELSRREVARALAALRQSEGALSSALAELKESEMALRRLKAALEGYVPAEGGGERQQVAGGEQSEARKAGEGDGSSDEGSSEEGGWSAAELVKLVELVGRHGVENWAAVAKQLDGKRTADCAERWEQMLRDALAEAQKKQEIGREVLHAAEVALMAAAREFEKQRQQMRTSMRQATAEFGKPASRPSSAAPRWPVSQAELREVEGHHELVLTCAPELMLKHDNQALLGGHKHRQSQYMAAAGLHADASHLKAEALDDVDIGAVDAALQWNHHAAVEMSVDAFLAHEDLRRVDDATRRVVGERGKPKRVYLDWMWWTEQGPAGESPWWIRSAADDHKVMVVLVVRGSVSFRIAGHAALELSAEQAMVCPAKHWVRALSSNGHVLTLVYGPQVKRGAHGAVTCGQ